MPKERKLICEDCGRRLNKREQEIYEQISNDNETCYCEIARRIYRLEKCQKKNKSSTKK